MRYVAWFEYDELDTCKLSRRRLFPIWHPPTFVVMVHEEPFVPEFKEANGLNLISATATTARTTTTTRIDARIRGFSLRPVGGLAYGDGGGGTLRTLGGGASSSKVCGGAGV